ncbi:MAG: O-phosphoserine--tRNA ligase, partial [Methermicoccaceae archaeon]
MFDPEELRRRAKEDFYGTWEHSSELLHTPHVHERYPRRSVAFGTPHPVFDIIQRMRDAYMRMGFDEVINPIIVDEMDVRRQFGPEAHAVLDRVYYIGGL